MSTRLHRFDFSNLRDFRAPLVAASLPEEVIIEDVPPPPPPPTFSESEIEAARSSAKQLGFAEGFEAGMARAAEQVEATRQTVDTTIMQLGNALGGLQQQYHQLLHAESESLSQLVLMIARKVTGTVLDTHGAESVTALVAQCLPAVISKPRLTVELNPDAFEATIDRIETLLHTSGFEGELQFRANPALGQHDTVLDWGAGQATRDTEALWQEIETLLASMPLSLSLPEEIPTLTVEQNSSDLAPQPTTTA